MSVKIIVSGNDGIELPMGSIFGLHVDAGYALLTILFE